MIFVISISNFHLFVYRVVRHKGKVKIFLIKIINGWPGFSFRAAGIVERKFEGNKKTKDKKILIYTVILDHLYGILYFFFIYQQITNFVLIRPRLITFVPLNESE